VESKEISTIYKIANIILTLTGILLLVLYWFMIPLSTLLKVVIYCFLGSFLVGTPRYIAELISKKCKNIGFQKATVLTIIMVLFVPVCLYTIYFVKRDSILRAIPANNIIDLQISFTKDLEYNNSVGNEWIFDIEINGNKFNNNENSKTLSFKTNDKLKINAKVIEADNISDVGRNSIEIDLKKLDLSKKNTFEIPVIVRENRGRYSGNTAMWNLKFSISRDIGFWGVIFSSFTDSKATLQSENTLATNQTSGLYSNTKEILRSQTETTKEIQNFNLNDFRTVKNGIKDYENTQISNALENPDNTIKIPEQKNSNTSNISKLPVDKVEDGNSENNSDTSSKKNFFTLGSSKEEVKKAMGTPEAIEPNLNWWYYGFSTVKFDENDKVIGWNTSGTPLKVK